MSTAGPQQKNARASKELQILDINIKYSVQEDNLNTWEEYKNPSL
jgi:hypothetical protein